MVLLDVLIYDSHLKPRWEGSAKRSMSTPGPFQVRVMYVRQPLLFVENVGGMLVTKQLKIQGKESVQPNFKSTLRKRVKRI